MAQALDAYQRALELKEQHGQQHELGSTHHQIGMVYQEQQQWQQALDAYQRALELKEQHGQQHEMGSTYHQIGMVSPRAAAVAASPGCLSACTKVVRAARSAARDG